MITSNRIVIDYITKKACNHDYFTITFIAPDKAAYCVFTQFRGPENAIKIISVRTKTQ